MFVGVDYFYITCTDPVDRYLLNQNEAEKIFHKKRAYNERYGSSEDVDSNPYKLKYCMICKKLVGMKSYHCLRC